MNDRELEEMAKNYAEQYVKQLTPYMRSIGLTKEKAVWFLEKLVYYGTQAINRQPA